MKDGIHLKNPAVDEQKMYYEKQTGLIRRLNPDRACCGEKSEENRT